MRSRRWWKSTGRFWIRPRSSRRRKRSSRRIRHRLRRRRVGLTRTASPKGGLRRRVLPDPASIGEPGGLAVWSDTPLRRLEIDMKTLKMLKTLWLGALVCLLSAPAAQAQFAVYGEGQAVHFNDQVYGTTTWFGGGTFGAYYDFFRPPVLG